MEYMTTYDYYGDFKNYATKHLGVSGMQFHYWEKLQDRIYSPNASMTPYILEEREMRVTQMDIFSRLMMDRILWVAGPVHDGMSTVVQAQLMFLDQLQTEDIKMYIDSPGGSVKSGLSMIDVMGYIHSDIITINTGMAASMGSILLGAGTKGKRFSLKNSKVMLHQVSSGAQGNIQDMRITLAETEKYNKVLFDLLGKYCDKDPKEVLKFTNRDQWLTATEAVEYGIIDEVIEKLEKK
jgi:ATP-dependent Clp protease protease subunit